MTPEECRYRVEVLEKRVADLEILMSAYAELEEKINGIWDRVDDLEAEEVG